MDSAKAAVKEFMTKSGHHDTTVHEKVAPAVTHETINRERHENIVTAIDKEVHQDHYHTSVQPIKDREVLPEQHHHNLAAVEHRQFEHGNDREVADRLKQEAAQFRDIREEGTERHTQSVAPTIAGEHIHHHVHETIQPVVNKETIEAHVVHTTVPIHEVHHNAAQHHSVSALPAVSMSEFKKQGGSLTGREERYDGFEGEPRSVGGHSGGLKGAVAGAAAGHHSGHTASGAAAGAAVGSAHDHHNSSTLGSSGTGLSMNSSHTGRDSISSDLPGSGHHSSTTKTGYTGDRSGSDHTGGRDYNTTGEHGRTSETKPSMMDKLNPMKDSDHDGKKGFMD